MQNLILENVSPQFMEIITPRLEDLQKDGKLEYVSILADGIIDLCIVIEDHYFLCMVVLFRIPYAKLQVTKKYLNQS